MSPDVIAEAHQNRLIRINQATTNRGLQLWGKVDFNALDASWAAIAPELTARMAAAQLAAAKTADSFNTALSREYGFDSDTARIVPEAFVGVDGSGRDTATLLRGSVTTTKEAVGAGLSRIQSLEAGATYLAAMIKTALADVARSSDMVSAVGKGYTRYVRVVEPGACSRCVILAGSERFSRPFKRHPACKCSLQAIPEAEYAKDPRYSPDGVFHAMTEAQQNKAFGRSGAQAIRDGADVNQVVSARRGASGIGYSHRMPTGSEWKRMQKTTIGYRPDGTPVQVYTTSEGTTVRGRFGKSQSDRATQRVGYDRYSTTKRVRLMPESITEIAGNDTELRHAFLRDAGYSEYIPKSGYGADTAKWLKEIRDQKAADRILVNRATKAYGNFYLGG